MAKFKIKNEAMYAELVELQKHMDKCAATMKEIRERVLKDMREKHASHSLIVAGAEFSLRENNKYSYSEKVTELEDKIEKHKIILKVLKEREVAAGVAEKESGDKVLVVRISRD